MQAKHTPGPWRAIGAAVHAPARHADSQRIADCRALLPDAELHANAALIAAAPELLAALQACARAYEDSVPADQKWTLGTNLAPDWYKFAHAAIARAIGPTDDQFLAALGPCGK